MDCNRGFLMERDITTGEIKPFFIKVRKSDIVNDDGTPYTGGGGGPVTPTPTPQPAGGKMTAGEIVTTLNKENYNIDTIRNIDDTAVHDIKLQEVITRSGKDSGIKRRMLYGTIAIGAKGINGGNGRDNWSDMFTNADATAYIEIDFPNDVLNHYLYMDGTPVGVRSYIDIKLTFDTTSLLEKYNTITSLGVQQVGKFLSRLNTHHMIYPSQNKIFLFVNLNGGGKSGQYDPSSYLSAFSGLIKPAIKIFMVSENI